MTDIVERLRNWSIDDVAETARDGTIEPGDILRWAALMREAADEIELLRAENRRYRTALLGICRPVWSTPPIDSEAASVYARVCKEMIDIAQFAIASPTHHNAPGQADANPSQCPMAENE